MLEEVEVLPEESVDLLHEHEVEFVVRRIEHELLERRAALGGPGKSPVDVDVAVTVQDVPVPFGVFDEAFRLVLDGDSFGNLFLGRYPHVQRDPRLFVCFVHILA